MSPEITESERREAYALLCAAVSNLLLKHPELPEGPPSYAEFAEDLVVADSYVEFMRMARAIRPGAK